MIQISKTPMKVMIKSILKHLIRIFFLKMLQRKILIFVIEKMYSKVIQGLGLALHLPYLTVTVGEVFVAHFIPMLLLLGTYTPINI